MRWLCENCGTVTADADLLQAPSPFDPATEMTGCPGCKAHDEFRAACAFCDRPACGGRNVDGVYQMLCDRHYDQNSRG
jgi:hypothetical protein